MIVLTNLTKLERDWMAPLERFELPTNRFEAGYSIQLSYRGVVTLDVLQPPEGGVILPLNESKKLAAFPVRRAFFGEGFWPFNKILAGKQGVHGVQFLIHGLLQICFIKPAHDSHLAGANG